MTIQVNIARDRRKTAGDPSLELVYHHQGRLGRFGSVAPQP
jgi:hypothetical protein